MAQVKQGKIKGLKLNQFKKKPDMMAEKDKPAEEELELDKEVTEKKEEKEEAPEETSE